MDINEAFRLFDIRGKYPEVVDERLAFALGKGLSDWKHPQKVLVGCDTRESSPSLKEFLIDGFGNSRVSVYDLGEAPMPMFNFAMTLDNYNLGVMVTASHIAEDDNGFKITLPGPIPPDQNEMLEIKECVQVYINEQIVVPKLNVTSVNVADQYVAKILGLVGSQKPKIKIAIEATKSAVLTTVMVLMQKIQADFHFVDSNYPGDPLIETNRRALVRDVLASGSDLGIKWDSDGDRVVFVDRAGKLIPMSFVLGLFGAAALEANLGKKVAIDVRAGLAVRDLVRKAGGNVVVVPAWNMNIKFAMRQDPDIVFGGETSGHFIFPEFYLIDDGILASLKFIRLFDTGNLESKLAELANQYYELPEQSFSCPIDKSELVIDKIIKIYRAKKDKISLEDGVTVYGPNYKFNLRPSVVEPLLRLDLESADEKTANEIVAQISKEIET